MRVLFYRYGSICEPFFMEGFQELGNTVDEMKIGMEGNKISVQERISLVSETLFKKSYDFVFSINYYPFLSEVCNIHKIRYLCQTVDSPILGLFSPSIKKAWNRIFLFDRAQYEEFYPLNPNGIFHLPLATNPMFWEKIIQSASSSERKKFSSDLSFVGSLYTEKCLYNKLDASPYLNGYLDGIMRAQMMIYGYHFLEEILTDEIVAAFKASMPNFYEIPETIGLTDKKMMVRMYLDYKITVMEREHMMYELGKRFPLSLYTGSSCNHLPILNKGLVNSLTEMPLVFHESKINLNFTSKSIRAGLPLRIFDILGCGGFLITNYQSELSDHFSIGEDLEVYTNIDELISKIEYYLSHEKDRLEIAENGYQKVLRYHNYPERILQMQNLAFETTS